MRKSEEFSIIDYEPQYKEALLDISLPWLKEYNVLEEIDIEMLKHPEEILENGGRIYFARMEDGSIGGTVTLYNLDEWEFEVMKLGVKKKYQGLGIGKKLMETAICEAKRSRKKKLILTSNHQLTAALGMYEKLGFQYIPCSDMKFELADIKMELIL